MHYTLLPHCLGYLHGLLRLLALLTCTDQGTVDDHIGHYTFLFHVMKGFQGFPPLSFFTQFVNLLRVRSKDLLVATTSIARAFAFPSLSSSPAISHDVLHVYDGYHRLRAGSP